MREQGALEAADLGQLDARARRRLEVREPIVAAADRAALPDAIAARRKRGEGVVERAGPVRDVLQPVAAEVAQRGRAVVELAHQLDLGRTAVRQGDRDL